MGGDIEKNEKNDGNEKPNQIGSADELRLDNETIKKILQCREGSGKFFLCCGSCITFALLLPIIGMSVILSDEGTIPFDEYSETGEIILIIAIVLFAVTTIICCFSCRALCIGGICCTVEAPPTNIYPLPNQIDAQDIDPSRSDRKFYVIYNPYGGYGKSKRLVKDYIKPIFEKHGIKADFIETEYGGHPTVLCRTLPLEGYEGVVVVGGDGSFHEAVNGMLNRTDGKSLPIGVVPGGTGNSFMSDYGMNDPTKAVEAIAAGHHSKCDANKIDFGNDKIVYSINVIGLGLIGNIGSLAERFRFLGESRYDIVGLWLCLTVPQQEWKFTIDGKEYHDAKSNGIFVNHTQFFGKGIRGAPGSIQDDGKMEIGFLSSANRAELLKVFLLIRDGRHVKGHPRFNFHQAKTFSAESTKPVPMIIDGENYLCEKSFKVECVSSAFSFFHPKPPAGEVAVTVAAQ